MSASDRPQFEYDVECGYLVCDVCEYPYYPMEVDLGELCMECSMGYVVESDGSENTTVMSP